jgi:hypothetical protein
MEMSSRARRWRSPEECVALFKLDAMGWTTLAIATGVSGVIIGLMLRVVSG